TYSSQIYDLATELGAQVEVLVDNPNGKRFSTDNISVEPFPMRSANYKGARFWIEVERHAAQMADRAARFGADLAIVHNHYSLIALPAFARRGIPTVLTMHNTLWPMGGRLNARKRALFTLAAPILRRSMGAAVVVSPECGRQLKELLGDLPVFAHVPQYPAYLSELVREPTRE